MLKVFITGEPGVGKTTIFSFLINELKGKNFRIAGFYCPEVRERGKRIGFEIVDITTGEKDWLAKENAEGSIKIGKYTVMEENATRIVNIVAKNMDSADILAIDEIGPMELSINSIKELINKMLNSDKPLIAVLHRKQKAPSGGKVYAVTLSNRNSIKYEILNYILNNI
ncbi:MAG: NTPase [Saccharolobus sp.]